jgi:hypothetical protein
VSYRCRTSEAFFTRHKAQVPGSARPECDATQEPNGCSAYQVEVVAATPGLNEVPAAPVATPANLAANAYGWYR